MRYLAYPRKMPQHQRGATLIVALIMLVLMLMLAVTGMRSITVETRIAAHMLEYRQLFEVADGSLRDGEHALTLGPDKLWEGAKVPSCAPNAPPLDASENPCWIADAKEDPNKLNTDWTRVAQASGFAKPYGYWYPRRIGIDCRETGEANVALMESGPGCYEIYEVNAQATHKNQAQDCGTDALCLRSAVRKFIQ